MKRIYILLMSLPVLFSSCEKWLEVAPEDQVNEDTLFETGDGYRNALNGVYIDMSSLTLYGKEMTWGLVDLLGQHYRKGTTFFNADQSSMYMRAIEYKFEDLEVKNTASAIWLKAFNAIANSNNLIHRVQTEDVAKFAGREQERDLIWGEALALRAYLHFDMLRMFAPAKDDGKQYIPYYENYGSTGESHLTVKEILGKAEKDLLSARRLVGSFDTIPEHKEWMRTGPRIEGNPGTNPPSEVFYAFRGYRMNYYAITALLARVYTYAERYEDAAKMAQEVIDAYDPDAEENFFQFTSIWDFGTNRKYYDGVIFAVTNNKIDEAYKLYTTGAINGRRMALDYKVAYENNTDDYRGITNDGGLLIAAGSYRFSNKYLNLGGNNDGDDMVPMLRLSEMYYIVSENMARKGDVTGAILKLDDVRTARGIVAGELAGITTWESYQKELIKEYRKDLVGEGQLFFQYKRFNVKPTTDTRFVFPLPDSETIN